MSNNEGPTCTTPRLQILPKVLTQYSRVTILFFMSMTWKKKPIEWKFESEYLRLQIHASCGQSAYDHFSRSHNLVNLPLPIHEKSFWIFRFFESKYLR